MRLERILPTCRLLTTAGSKCGQSREDNQARQLGPCRPVAACVGPAQIQENNGIWWGVTRQGENLMTGATCVQDTVDQRTKRTHKTGGGGSRRPGQIQELRGPKDLGSPENLV